VLYRTWWEGQHWKVLEQDRTMLVGQRGLASRLYEHAAQSDVGVLHLRRLLRREYQRQLKIYLEASEGGRSRDPEIAEAEEAPG
jgi:hypothetical protein